MRKDEERIATELSNLKKSKLTPEEREFKKSFANHFLKLAPNVNLDQLAVDYERIAKIKEDYPVMDFMNLFGQHNSIHKIDLAKLFE